MGQHKDFIKSKIKKEPRCQWIRYFSQQASGYYNFKQNEINSKTICNRPVK
jgi:hypothetical protein